MNPSERNGLLRRPVLEAAAHALRRCNGNRSEAERLLRRIGGRPYRGPGAQLSDELIPRFYHQAADVVAFVPGRTP